MYAVVIIKGFQHSVSVGDELAVQKFEGNVGDKTSFDEVLMLGDGKKSVIGTPFVPKSKVDVTILKQGKDKKITMLKKKRRKGYKVKRGHRQELTWIRVDGISGGSSSKPKPKPKKVAAEATAESE
ncbi:MAG: 50S ribosomal protein L21 [Candidatus Marinimicrobia bacterium]|nr:50S ribosomal protein L21 [Candidatus Neomarinimicrobiota bacterium]MCH8305100.1 50S ribosomal protein L21 [Candidatus Neomarinimicrobiota bacterium]